MGTIQKPLPVKLFMGILTSIPDSIPHVIERLVACFGAVDLRSELFPFDLTHYYDETMGTPLYRHFLSFAEPIEPSSLAEIKIKTNEMESATAGEHSTVRRPVNLDPGYLEQSKIVLASTKNFYHRILLSRGIYAEVTLHFEKGAWRPFPWTFPDFKTDRYYPFFLALRDLYKAQLDRISHVTS